MVKKRIVVVCPGRGSYTKENLGTLKNRSNITLDLQMIDKQRSERGYPTLTELDSANSFKTSLHTKGEHASPLIYACSKADFLDINQEKYEIVAVLGNSMGWYLALAFTQVLNPFDSFHLIQTMGSMMEGGLVGGQIIYPVIDDQWRMDLDTISLVNKTLHEVSQKEGCEVFTSIHLGGYKVLAGNKQGLSELTSRLPKKEHYPFQLVNHGAFHTPLLKEISQKAEHSLYQLKFNKPHYPLIDGRGHVWQPYSTSIDDIYNYTIGHQVTETYDFTRSVEVALKEFAPDHLVLLGPGNSLGGAIGQTLIKNSWENIHSKEDFVLRQKKDPLLISMDLLDQKKKITVTARTL